MDLCNGNVAQPNNISLFWKKEYENDTRFKWWNKFKTPFEFTATLLFGCWIFMREIFCFFFLKTINGSVRNRMDIFRVFIEICNSVAVCWADKRRNISMLLLLSMNISNDGNCSLFDYANFWFIFIIITFVNAVPKE